MLTQHPLRRLRTPILALATAGLALAGVGVAGPAAAAAPGNDALGAATALTPGSAVIGSTDEATLQAGENRAGGDPAVRTVWYTYTPVANQTVGFRGISLGDNSDTYFSLYSGPAVAPTFAGLTFLDDNDDSSGYYSYLSADLIGGTTYYLQVDTYDLDVPKGSFGLRLETPAGAPAGVPANDNLAGPARLIPNLDSPVDNRLATSEGAEPLGLCGPNNNSVWFTYTPAVDRDFEVETTGAVGSVVNVWSGPAGATAAQLVPVGCDNDSTGDSSPDVTGLAGTHYYVQVGSPTPGGSPRPFTVNVDESWDFVTKVTATGSASGTSLKLTGTVARDPYGNEVGPFPALTGSVEFLAGATSLGSAPVDAAGVGTLTIPRPSVGSHTYLAVFTSTAAEYRDTFRVVTISVPKLVSTVKVKAPKKVTIKAKEGKNGKPVIKPKKVKVKATLSTGGPAATGKVLFKVGKKTVKGTLKNGVAKVKIAIRKTTKVKISYAGDANTAPVTAKVKIKVVIKKP